VARPVLNLTPVRETARVWTEIIMLDDLGMMALIMGFFALAWLYVETCKRL